MNERIIDELSDITSYNTIYNNNIDNNSKDDILAFIEIGKYLQVTFFFFLFLYFFSFSFSYFIINLLLLTFLFYYL